MGTFDACPLEDVEENKNDANTSAVSKPASGLTCRDHDEAVRRDHGKAEGVGQSTATRHSNKADREATRAQKTDTAVVTGSQESGGPEQRDARVQTMATSVMGAVHDQSGWCVVEESISPT